MPSESGLRHLFDAPMPAGSIDVAAVVRRSRARRLPKVLGVTGVSLLAIGGLVVGGLQLGGGVSPASDAGGMALESADSSELYSSADEAMKAPADKINFCTGTVAEMADESIGIVLSLDFPDAAAGSASVEGVVTMTNVGTEQWTGYTGPAPAITLSQDGVVLWHTNGPSIQIARDVDLAPGASVEYAASFEPVRCDIEDDAAESFRTALPAVPAGEYQLSAAIDLVGDDGTVLVSGPPQTVTLY